MPWLLASSILWLVIVLFLIRRAVAQRDALQQLLPGAVARAPAPSVSVIVPARNEAHNIEACTHALLAQDYPPCRFRLWVIDDCSTDGTAVIVRKLARADPRVTFLVGCMLPDGWIGKSHACWLATREIPEDVRWFCFIDADMRAEPALLTSAVAAAQNEDLALLSLAPRHELKTFAERLMISCGLCVLGFRQNLRGARPEHTDTVATGQFFLVRRDAYEAAGGHRAVASEICEDLAFARLLKKRGERVAMMDASTLLSTRMYTGWRTLWPGFAKNLTEMLGGPTLALASAFACVALAAAALALPALDAALCREGDHGGCVALAPAVLAGAIMTGLHVAVALHLGIPFWYGLVWPLGYVIGAAMVFDSLRWRWLGRVNWKGRTYRAAHSQ
jgi:chlorobactene glucosyltransferase